ncbi:MAG TPA: bifunctional DNA-binding transcriptional regulator/O6-methylguanine-DNA methyltransferase Ada [Gemmatimonadaceae bacterium]|nr:bifunctional DNA-binding transcriptional regulator/O6-methylguanine-DNA methyltransferase Ada [Gemmatimonadaceae bacterium]
MTLTTESLPPTAPLTPDAAWRAVLARDHRSDDRFVYGVSSTGVFCRASCPSRRPRREHVSFFGSPADAIRHGFRACKRCRPEETSLEHALVAHAKAALERQVDRPMSLRALAEELGTTPARVRRVFARWVGLSPKAYHDALRARRFRAQLRAGDTVGRATYEAGYGSSSRVYERDAAHLGMSPAAYRRGGRGMRIRYTVVDSSLGTVLVARTERGVCAVSLGDDARALEAGLRGEFPAAEITLAADADHAWVRAVLARFTTGAAGAVPLDVEGTAFQWLVWNALRAIPPGSTRSYREVAAMIDRPTAARAVARACATNPVALVIPCHRVVREDGALGGYRWGLGRKERILQREGARTRERAGDRPGNRG